MLDAVAQLAGDLVGDVDRVLGDEIDADALGADQAHDLLDLFEQRRRGVVEQQMGLVEKEAQLGFVGIADLGQLLEQFRQQPQQEGRIEPRAGHQPVGGEDVDDPAALSSSLMKSSSASAGSPKKWSPPWAAQLEQRALDRADRLLRDIAIFERQRIGLLADMDQHRLQVVEVEQQQAVLVGDIEGDGEHAFLHLVEVHQPRQQQRPHFGDRGAHRVALLPEQVPELDRKASIGPVGQAELGGARREQLVRLGGRRSPAMARPARSPLTSATKVGTPAARQPLDDALKGDGLAGAGRAGDQPVAVGALELERLGIGAAGGGADEDADSLTPVSLACHFAQPMASASPQGAGAQIQASPG